MYKRWVKKTPINSLFILLESCQGNEISGNVFYLLKELATNSDYKKYSIFITCRKKNKTKIESILNNYDIKKYKLVYCNSLRYLKVIASAKFIFTDTYFLPFFVKKDGQIYFNAWHEPPLKILGRKNINDMHNIGNLQKNLICADYLLYPNEYTMNHIVKDYMIENISHAQCVLTGYPKNAIFYDKERAKKVRQKGAINYNKVYVYMPTWHGITTSNDKDTNKIFKETLEKIDARLRDDEILFVNLQHLSIKCLDLTSFQHIKDVPEYYETYDFLNCSDCLITDYSSVIYDYAISEKKCVLFINDEEKYFDNKGINMDFSDLPFPKVQNIEELIKEIRSPKNYDDTNFLKQFCAYECKDATKKVLDLIFTGKHSEGMKFIKMPNNGKKNILIYSGNLSQNGITASLFNLLRKVDTKDVNYYICFPKDCGKTHRDTLETLPKGIEYIPMIEGFNLNPHNEFVWKQILSNSFLQSKFIKINYVAKSLKNDWKHEIKRLFGNAYFDNVIQFYGYDNKYIMMFAEFDCKKTIYVHSDMKKEIETRENQREDILRYAYRKYDNVALVTEGIWNSTAYFVENTDNFKIVHNVIAYEDIINRGEAELIFDEKTKCNKTFEEVKTILNSKAKKIISVGRFSPEKDHKRLVDAFTNVWKENNDTYFIIIGGNQYKDYYKQLSNYVKTLPSNNHIILILSMFNPMPIVKSCDGFILASHYEAAPVVIFEADIHGLPIVSTDITGPRTFMKKNNGTLVPNTLEGVEKGFRLLLENKVPLLTTDYKKYNENAINEFYSLLE